VRVDGINVDGKKFVVATGSSPRIPSIPGIESVDYLTNVEALGLKHKPASMVVLGGRALGLEFAQMYSHMGTRVTLLQRSDRIIPEEEPAISDALRQYLEEEGIKIKTGERIKRVSDKHDEKTVDATAEQKEAHERGYNCACRTIPMSKVPKAIVIRDTRGLIKMVAEASTGRILGVHILADGAADIIHEAVLAVKYRLTIDDIVDTVHVFP